MASAKDGLFHRFLPAKHLPPHQNAVATFWRISVTNWCLLHENNVEKRIDYPLFTLKTK